MESKCSPSPSTPRATRGNIYALSMFAVALTAAFVLSEFESGGLRVGRDDLVRLSQGLGVAVDAEVEAVMGMADASSSRPKRMLDNARRPDGPSVGGVSNESSESSESSDSECSGKKQYRPDSSKTWKRQSPKYSFPRQDTSECIYHVAITIIGLSRSLLYRNTHNQDAHAPSWVSISKHVVAPLRQSSDTCVSTFLCVEHLDKGVPPCEFDQMIDALNLALVIPNERNMNAYVRIQHCYHGVLALEANQTRPNTNTQSTNNKPINYTHFMFVRPDSYWHAPMTPLKDLPQDRISARARVLFYLEPKNITYDHLSWEDACEFPANWVYRGGGPWNGIKPFGQIKEKVRAHLKTHPLSPSEGEGFHMCSMMDDQFGIIPRKWGAAWYDFWSLPMEEQHAAVINSLSINRNDTITFYGQVLNMLHI
mmetsp:Transcript_21672/g.34243  ORF Transcript_21672/g.34243 Transcript_21672/m.34243 type:complete len:424 (-) Transcript_21672:4-1275(-)